jgi:hypothetical protein
MASGNGGQIGLAKISSLYRDVNTVNLWTNFTSESLEHKLSELEEGSITGRRDAPNSYKGLDSGEGDVSFEPNPNALGHFFGAWFGTIASSVVTAAGSTGANSGQFAGAGQFFHRFTPLQNSYSDRTFLPPYNVMVYRDVGSAWLFKQSILHTLKVNIQANQLVKATGTFMSRTVDRIERVAAIQSLVSSGGRPWVWDMASVEISTNNSSAGLAATDDFEAFNLSFSLPHEGVPLLDGTKKYAEFVPSDFRRITFDGTMSFRDQDEYNAFTAYESRRMRVTLLNVNSNLALGNVASLAPTAFLGYPGLRFHIPAMKFLSWSAPISGPNRLTASFTAKAEYSEADGFSVAAELLNIVPNADYTTAY